MVGDKVKSGQHYTTNRWFTELLFANLLLLAVPHVKDKALGDRNLGHSPAHLHPLLNHSMTSQFEFKTRSVTQCF